MKETRSSWRAQKGTKVRYAIDKHAGSAVVLSVLAPARVGKGDGSGSYLIRDMDTGVEYTANGTQIVITSKGGT